MSLNFSDYLILSRSLLNVLASEFQLLRLYQMLADPFDIEDCPNTTGSLGDIVLPSILYLFLPVRAHRPCGTFLIAPFSHALIKFEYFTEP